MSLAKGTRFGPYEITALIGVGGMGEVYRALDTNLKRDVALKVLPDSLVTDATRVARLQREAEILAALNHGNVAHIYGLERSDGRMALVMELIEGPNLSERIAEGALPEKEALDVALQLVGALEAAHERGIVHRDLKPANIKLKPDGTVKVLDFGIAKALDARATGSQQATLTTPAMTEAGVVLGTAAYMSPEQARGKSVDRRTDVWAFGCVLYEMLTGEAAFLGDDVAATLARVLERDPDMRKLPARLPPAVRSTLELCLQKDPKKRLHDIVDVRLALEGKLSPASTQEDRPLWRRALPLAAAVAGGAVLASGLAILMRPPPPAVAPQAALPVTRFIIAPDPAAPLANLGGYDVMISADGQRIAYFGQSSDDGNTALYVREIDGLEARVVPGTDIGNQSGPGGNMNPFFSPDGRSIGFLSPGRGVVRVPLDGGSPIKIVDPPSPVFLGASWADDDTLVYSAGRELYRVSARGGGTPERLVDGGSDAFIASPVLLPGGNAVMYTFIQGDVERRIRVLDLDTRVQKLIVENGQNAFYSHTGHIVFARGTTLMAAPFDLAQLEVTGDPVALAENVRHPNSQTAADFALSATGTLIYVPAPSEASMNAAVVWVDRSGQVVGRAVEASLENPRDPALSPDGTRLLLTTGPQADGDLWSYDLRGRPPIRLAALDDDRLPAWSPDSRQVAFTVTIDGANASIHTVLADGSMLAPQPLRAQPVGANVGSWSAADELIIVMPPFATSDIGVVPVSGEALPRKLMSTSYPETDVALSPDGRWLAYVSNRTGTLEVWAQRYPDGAPVRVSTNGGYEPRWAADSQELFYLAGSAVMAVALEPGDNLSFSTPLQLFSGSYLMQMSPTVHSYAVARDGRFVMIQLPGGASPDGDATNIVVVQNWSGELERRVPNR